MDPDRGRRTAAPIHRNLSDRREPAMKEYAIRYKTKDGTIKTDTKSYKTKAEAEQQISRFKDSPAFQKLWIVYRTVSEWKEEKEGNKQ